MFDIGCLSYISTDVLTIMCPKLFSGQHRTIPATTSWFSQALWPQWPLSRASTTYFDSEPQWSTSFAHVCLHGYFIYTLISYFRGVWGSPQWTLGGLYRVRVAVRRWLAFSIGCTLHHCTNKIYIMWTFSLVANDNRKISYGSSKNPTYMEVCLWICSCASLLAGWPE